MEHENRNPTAFAANRLRVFLTAIASGLLVLSLVTELLGGTPVFDRGQVEASLSQELTAPIGDCELHAERGAARCQQAEVILFSAGDAASAPVRDAGPRYFLFDAGGQLQHRPDRPLRPPVAFSPTA